MSLATLPRTTLERTFTVNRRTISALALSALALMGCGSATSPTTETPVSPSPAEAASCAEVWSPGAPAPEGYTEGGVLCTDSDGAVLEVWSMGYESDSGMVWANDYAVWCEGGTLQPAPDGGLSFDAIEEVCNG